MDLEAGKCGIQSVLNVLDQIGDGDADEAQVGGGGEGIDIDLGTDADLSILYEEGDAFVCAGQQAVAEAEYIARGCAGAGAFVEIDAEALIVDVGGDEDDSAA